MLTRPPPSRHDPREVVLPHLVRGGREDLVPDLRERAAQLAHARRAPDEPPVQVLGALAPAADVDHADLADEHGALDAAEHTPCSRASSSGRSAGPAECSRGSSSTRPAARRLARRRQPPALVGPEVLVVGLRAGRAVDSARAGDDRLGLRRPQRARPQVALERPAVPVVRPGACAARRRPAVELLRGLGHRTDRRDHKVRRVEWPPEFYAPPPGTTCPLCAQGRPEETPHGCATSQARRRTPTSSRGHPARPVGRRLPRPPRRRADRAERGEAAAYGRECCGARARS